MVTQEYALAPGGECGCVTWNWIKVTSYSSYFQILTTWRLYFLMPKVPTKVVWSSCSFRDDVYRCDALHVLNKMCLNCIFLLQIETTFNFLEIRSLTSHPEHQVLVIIFLVISVCMHCLLPITDNEFLQGNNKHIIAVLLRG